ncbi:MAG: phosphate acyltransferase, partial [Thermomicrobiaceae bacterium]|nr:phosphate acyltransferase [Thermomicrobiaceae bacterium]
MAERDRERPSGAARVVVDAMGGDRAPREPVEAAVRAVRERRIPVTLVGRSSEVEPILRGLGASTEEVALIDAPEVVAMEEHAV